MPSSRRPLFLIALALLAVPTFTAAQRLEPGTWTGTVTPPGQSTVNATFDVSMRGDTVGITLKGEFGSFPLSEIKVAADRITFTFAPGTTVRCTLMLREDRSYSGDCLDSEGGIGVIVMTPPARLPGPAGLKPGHGAGA